MKLANLYSVPSFVSDFIFHSSAESRNRYCIVENSKDNIDHEYLLHTCISFETTSVLY